MSYVFPETIINIVEEKKCERQTPDTTSSLSDRCPFCGEIAPFYSEEPVNGHYQTTCCRQTTSGCCDGSVG